MKITVIVITENEEKNIKDCLESAEWADELIVVDSNSSDSTVQIAKTYTNNIYNVDIKNVTEKRKFSVDKASNDWIFFLDADERITPELKDELLNLSANNEIDAYYINRKNYYLGKPINHCGMNPDFHIRLFNRKKATVNDRIVHEGIVVKGKTAKLTNCFLHYTVNDFRELIKKINYYSTMESLVHFQNGKKITKAGAFTHMIAAFLVMYISRKGFKDGAAGFFLSTADALTNFMTHLKLLKNQDKL